MRHRNQITEKNTPATTLSGVTGTLESLTQRLAADDAPAPTGGKHRRAVAPVVPSQRAPFEAGGPAPAAQAPVTPVQSLERALRTSPVARTDQSLAAVPHLASWTGSHAPRIVAGILMSGAVVGTAALAVRFLRAPGSESLAALVTGAVAVVLLWAAMIASTPQVVSLTGSVLTIRSSDGSERFDLADGLQPVDIVDHPKSSQWAVLLHRADRTSVVLRRHDVVAEEFDPIVRHYRRLADKSWSDRQARFSR